MQNSRRLSFSAHDPSMNAKPLDSLSNIYKKLSTVSRRNIFKPIKNQIILIYILHYVLDGILFRDLLPNLVTGFTFLTCLYLCIQHSIHDLLHHINGAFLFLFGVLLFSSGNYMHKLVIHLPQLSLIITNNTHFAILLQSVIVALSFASKFERFSQIELYGSTMLVGILVFLAYTLKQADLKVESLQAHSDSLDAQLKEVQLRLQESRAFNKNFHLTISHELRNPLNNIMGNIDLVQKKMNPEDSTQENIKMAKLGCETLLNSLNNTLDYCKAEFDEIDVNYVSVNIRKSFEKIWGTCAEFLKLRGLKGELYLHANVPPMILIDPGRLNQIILNLVHNASKFTSKGFVKIIVSWHSILTNNNGNFSFGSERMLSDNEMKQNSKRPSTPEKVIINSSDLTSYLEEDIPEDACDAPKISFSPSMSYNKLDLETKKFPKMYRRRIPNSMTEGIGFLKIQVIDSGVGIHSSNMSKLFQKFSKFTHDNVSRVEGSGLGLWITKKICNKMEGYIQVHSDVGKGSTFLVFLKCEISPQSLGTPTPSPCLSARRDRANIQSMGTMPYIGMNQKSESILNKSVATNQSIVSSRKDEELKLTAMVVDDIPYNQQLNRQFLELCGVEVKHIAENGLEAFKKFANGEKDELDVIFMDLDMPIMDGKTSSAKIREWEKTNKVRPVIIVILTGNCSETELKLCLDKSGDIKADYFYRKPISLSDCQNLIQQLKREKSKKKSLLSNFPRIADHILLYESDLFQQALLENYMKVGQIKYYIANHATILEKFTKNIDSICAILYNCENISEGFEEYKKLIQGVHDISKKKGKRHIPIICIVKEVDRSQLVRLKQIGFSDFLMKPFDFDSLTKLLRSHIVNGFPI